VLDAVDGGARALLLPVRRDVAQSRGRQAAEPGACTMTLAEWLRVQIDIDKLMILERWDSDGRSRVATMWTGPDPGYTTVASDGNRAAPFWIADGREVSDARRVQVLWDPAVELIDLAARLRIIELHDRDHECSTYDRDEVDNCAWIPRGDDCSTLCLLAMRYADRAGYREEWRS
jgi:hypothetical protein